MLEPKRNDARKKKLLFRVGGRPVWLRECWVFEMQRRRGRRSNLEGVKMATKLSLDLLYTVAGVSCKNETSSQVRIFENLILSRS